MHHRTKPIFLMVFLALPLVVLLLMEACSPAGKFQAQYGLVRTSSVDICSSQFQPVNVSQYSKAQTQLWSPFSENKLQISSSGLQKASINNLRDIPLLFTVNLSCVDLDSSELFKQIVRDTSFDNLDLEEISLPYTFAYDLSEDELAAKIEGDPCIVGVSRQGDIRTASLSLPSTTDSNVSLQSYLQATNYLHAYQYLASKQSASGPKVKMAFVDTGIDCNHPDLSGNLVSDCGFNITSPTELPTDVDGHGSHTAGQAAAVTNNGIGITGIAGKQVELHAIKVIHQGTGTASNAANGIQKAIDRGVDVINISLESKVRLSSVENAVSNAVNAGIVVIMAAGNHSGILGTTIDVSPAIIGTSLPGAITVGSIDINSNILSSFSNYGDLVEIATYGAVDSNQIGAAGGHYSTTANAQYKRLMGTSQAAPIIAGAAALVIQFLKQHDVDYTVIDIENIILASTDSYSEIPVKNHRVFNFSKLVRNTYEFANIELCD